MIMADNKQFTQNGLFVVLILQTLTQVTLAYFLCTISGLYPDTIMCIYVFSQISPYFPYVLIYTLAPPI